MFSWGCCEDQMTWWMGKCFTLWKRDDCRGLVKCMRMSLKLSQWQGKGKGGSKLVMNSEIFHQGFQVREGHGRQDWKMYLPEDMDSVQMRCYLSPVLLVNNNSIWYTRSGQRTWRHACYSLYTRFWELLLFSSLHTFGSWVLFSLSLELRKLRLREVK